MQVRFNDVEEFLAELEHDRERIDRGIVRVTKTLTQTAQLPIQQLAVVATARVGDTVVRLERYCGDLWGKEFPQDAETHERAEKVMRKLEDACRGMGLEVRAGILELEPCRTPR